MNLRIATRDAYGEALVEIGSQNEKIVVLDADLSKSTKTSRFAAVFPERFFDMGIAEQNMMGTAAGLAAAGKIPFASTFAVFATSRVMDQVRNSIAYPKLNVKIAATHAGITVGEDGASHQSVEDLALMRAVPNMAVIVPADAVEARAAVRFAAQYQGPVYLRLGRPKVPVIFDEGYQFSFGRPTVVKDGGEVAVFATGIMVGVALEAAGILKDQGVDCRVLNVSTLKPVDPVALVEGARGCRAVVSAEEHSIIGGLGSLVAEAFGEHRPLPLRRVGIPDVFGQSGAPGELMEYYGLTPEAVARAAREAVEMAARL